MPDSTLVGVAIFTLIQWILIAVVVLTGIALVRRIVKKAQATEEPEKEIGSILWNSRFRISAWLMLFLGVIYYVSMEQAYRPKTDVAPRNIELERQMQAIDDAPSAEIPPATTDLKPDWEAAKEQNRQENANARENFMSLPDDDSN